MKIIKPGVVVPKWWWIGKQFSCRSCGCVFQMEQGDHPNNDLMFTIPCPTCKQTLRCTRPLAESSEALFEEVFGKENSIFADLFGKPKV